MAIRLTPRDFEILGALTTAVRVMTVSQIGRGWWSTSSDPVTDARHRIRLLCTAGFLRIAKVLAMPLPQITAPLTSWKPGDSEPDCGNLSWMARSRWRHGAKQIQIVMPSGRGARLFSGKSAPALSRHFQMTHDLGLAEVFLAFRSQRPHLIPAWRGEASYRHLRRNRKIPDAVITSSDLWPPIIAVEFAGAYSRERVRKFHYFCQQERLAYELW